MHCPNCQSQKVIKRGFNDRTGTPMGRLRTPSSLVSVALNARTEGMGVRATGRTFGKSYTTIMRWEQRLADKLDN